MIDLCLVFVRFGAAGPREMEFKKQPRGTQKNTLDSNWFNVGRMSSKRGSCGCQLVPKWCQNQANNDCHASAALVIGHWSFPGGRSGTLVWRAAKGRLQWMAGVYGGRPKAAQEYWSSGRPKAASIGWRACMGGGRRPPKTTRHLGGRPKVALACSLLILALACRRPTASSKHFKRFSQQLNSGHLYSDSVWPAFGGP